jgi:hypothetical protein
MKHIKQYEKLIKKNSDSAKNHELNKLSDFILDIFEKLKIINRQQYPTLHEVSFVKKFYTDDNGININYNIMMSGEKYKIGSAHLNQNENIIQLGLEMRKYKYDNNSQYVYDFFFSKLKDYNLINYDDTAALYNIPLTQDQLIDKLIDINIYFDANKYNL